MNHVIEYRVLPHPFGHGNSELRIEYNSLANIEDMLKDIRQALEFNGR